MSRKIAVEVFAYLVLLAAIVFFCWAWSRVILNQHDPDVPTHALVVTP